MKFIHISDWHLGKIIIAGDRSLPRKHFDRYQCVVLDLQGCRTGNMNEAIK